MSIFLITAPSGAGKTTIAQNLQRTGLWNECISHTTRPMRENEVEGVTYYYIDKEQFKIMYAKGEFAERVEYDKNLYGVSHAEIERVKQLGKSIFIIVENDGYKQIKGLYPDAIGIFIYMSKEDCLANMLLRGDSYEKAINRISTYEEEMANRNQYDYVVKNVRDKIHNVERIISNIVGQYDQQITINTGGIFAGGVKIDTTPPTIYSADIAKVTHPHTTYRHSE